MEILEMAGSMQAEIVRPADREAVLEQRTENFPETRDLLSRGAYFTKLQLPVCEEVPYFYFDSDITWLAPIENLEGTNAANAFSTESWSWYYGISDDTAWIRDRVPRRVNSGFYYLSETFPFKRMEQMLREKHFDPELPDNTDQEIMAYLYRDMEYYHPDDLKRSRRGIVYDLRGEPAAALHFPGGMWRDHLNQMEAVGRVRREPVNVRFMPPVPISKVELLRMRAFMGICMCQPIQRPLNLLRRLRNIFK